MKRFTHSLGFIDKEHRPIADSMIAEGWSVAIGKRKPVIAGDFELTCPEHVDLSNFWREWDRRKSVMAQFGIATNLTRYLRGNRGLFTHKVKMLKFKVKWASQS